MITPCRATASGHCSEQAPARREATCQQCSALREGRLARQPHCPGAGLPASARAFYTSYFQPSRAPTGEAMQVVPDRSNQDELVPVFAWLPVLGKATFANHPVVWGTE